MLELLQSWLGDVEAIARRVPEIAAATGEWSWVVAVLAAAAGFALLLVGVRLGPLLTGIGGALVGWFAGVEMASLAEVQKVPIRSIAWAVGGSMGVASLFAPPVYPLLLGAIPGALLGLRSPIGGGGWLGAAVGAAVLAGICLALRRVVVAATAAVAGAVLVVAALVALSVTVPAVEGITHRPVLLTGIGALLAVASTAFQAGVQGRSEPRSRQRSRPGSLRQE